MTGDPISNSYTQQHRDTYFALITAALDARLREDMDDPVLVDSFSKVLDTVPKDVLTAASLHVITMLIRQAADAEDRDPRAVWRDITLDYANVADDWRTNLRSWCDSHGEKLRVTCSHDDADRIQRTADEAGLSDLVSVEPAYIVPRGLIWVPNHRDLPDAFYKALGVNKWL
ncbi:hypothetical protein ACQEVF_56740 [Nonomuraea polychroma]|uniref:hypothetical protein n=1 Tax=Nonomuraea polychroma TaxID=46176 RepID=UPI003D8CA9B5